MTIADMRMLLLGASIGLVASLCFYLLTPAKAAKPRVIYDQCNQTSGDGMGHECSSEDHLLIRLKYSDGSCGDWICCPPNPDGQTYNCASPENPTLVGSVKDRFSSVLGPRASTFDPGPRPKNPKGQVAPKVKNPVKSTD
jgi:hypothetical protein